MNTTDIKMTAANNTLKPCPFCGGDNVHIVKREVEPQGDPWYGVKEELFPMCDDCGCCLFDGYFHEGFVNREAAISKWNTRAPTEAQGDDPKQPDIAEKLAGALREILDQCNDGDGFTEKAAVDAAEALAAYDKQRGV